MIGRNTIMGAMALSLALGLAASPAVARSGSMRAGYDARAEAPAGGIRTSAHRAQALRECNEASAKLVEYTWGDEQSDKTRACMAEHGEGE
jgi:hypothetical protein